MKDTEILDMLRSKPKEGLTAVVDQYSAYVLKIARVKLCDVCTSEDIEDAVSDIFLQFYISGQKYGFKINSLKAFISTIAARHCMNIFKEKIRSVQTVPFDDLDISDRSEIFDTDADALVNAIHSLGETDEQIFVRKYFFGQKNEDIARELNMKANTVSRRISRGLVKLKRILEEEK